MDNNTVTHRENKNPFGAKPGNPQGNKKPLKNPFGNINVYDDPVVDMQPRGNQPGGTQAALKNPFGNTAPSRGGGDELQGNINLRGDSQARRSFEYQPGPEVNSGWGGQYDTTATNVRMNAPTQDPYAQQGQPSQNSSLISSIINPSSILSSVFSIGSAFGQPQGQQPGVQQQQQEYYDEENEPPLLEDLGIDLELIKQRTISVVKFRKIDERFVMEADMSGPLLLALLFGAFQLLSGKLHFGYIYGFGVCGTIGIYMIMNLIGQTVKAQLYNTMSILGYCLLPIVMLSGVNVVLSLKNIFGFVLGAAAIGWATLAATNFFEILLRLDHRKWLLGYPIFLFYLIFVLITIF